MFDSLKNSKISYEPYKYVMQDTGSIYIGAKFSYEELINNETMSFKLKAVLSQYILKDTDSSTTIESHMYYLEKGSFAYSTFEQLKVKVKAQVLEEKKSLLGKRTTHYVEKVYSLGELTDINLAKKKGAGMVITEIVISKLALMSFTL